MKPFLKSLEEKLQGCGCLALGGLFAGAVVVVVVAVIAVTGGGDDDTDESSRATVTAPTVRPPHKSRLLTPCPETGAWLQVPADRFGNKVLYSRKLAIMPSASSSSEMMAR